MDTVKIDLTCPTEIFRTALPTEGIPAVSMIMYNLSDRVITSAEVTVTLLSGGGDERDRVTFRGRALNGRPHSTFSMNVPMNPDPDAKRADVRIDKVWFSDNSVWRREEGTDTEYTPNNLPNSPALVNLKFAAGENAVGYPSQQDGLWVCICGRPNPDRETVCARCRMDKNAVFARFGREAVERQVSLRERQLDLSTRSVREDTARLQRIREKEYEEAKTRNHRRWWIAACLALFLALTAGVLGGAVPFLRLVEAKSTMAEGDYETAKTQLQELEGFSGVPEKIAECDWQILLREAQAALAREPDPEADAGILERLENVEDREEASALADRINLRQARRLLEEAQALAGTEKIERPETDFAVDDRLDEDGVIPPAEEEPRTRCMQLLDQARETVSALAADHPDRIALEQDCTYTEALDIMFQEEYLEAKALFDSLEDYSDAKDKSLECFYLAGRKLVADGKPREALEILKQVPVTSENAENIKKLTQTCYFMIGEEYETQGMLEEAWQAYFDAGDFTGAKAKVQSVTLRMATAEYDEGHIDEAMRLCASIPQYPDAFPLTYLLGKMAYEDQEYSTAYQMFQCLPDEYENTLQLRTDSAYQAGKRAMNQKDWDQAAILLTAAGEYKDAQKLLAQVQKEQEALQSPSD